MTKKEFKERSSFHVYGYGKNKWNVIYYNWEEPVDTFGRRGWKYGFALKLGYGTKAELFNSAYDFLFKEEPLPYYIWSRIAKNDSDRFKTPIALSINNSTVWK